MCLREIELNYSVNLLLDYIFRISQLVLFLLNRKDTLKFFQDIIFQKENYSEYYSHTPEP